MDFILRIFFSGLMAFVPGDDGRELNVILLNVDHSHHTSDGTMLAPHRPLLVARAGSCSGTCPRRDTEIAQFLFADQPRAVAVDALENAVGGGAAWALRGADLSLRKGSASAADLPPLVYRRGVRSGLVPTTAAERTDYGWLADLQQICGAACRDLKPSLFAAQPPPNLVAARLRLRSGNVFTYSIARSGSDVTPMHFKRLDGRGSASPYTQAIAAWVGVDIAVSGEDIELVEAAFDGRTSRSMRLAPDANGRVEVAVLNLPPFAPAATPASLGPGKHFEYFYELAATPPAREARLVPHAGPADAALAYPRVTWQSVHPRGEIWSELLNRLRLDIGRTLGQPLLCPPVGL